MENILNKIVADKYIEVEEAKKRVSVSVLQDEINPRLKDTFLETFETATDTVLIAEIKKASPSKGVIRDDFDVEKIAGEYEKAQVGAVSILTDEKYFQGHIEYIPQAKSLLTRPVLRKEFIVDEYQIYEAAAFGADSFLLIRSVLDEKTIERFVRLGTSLNMTPLVEVHNAEELRSVLNTSARIVGVNNRNLRDFTVSLETTMNLMDIYKTREDVFAVSESGIFTREDVVMLKDAGVKGVLVGESLMREENIEAKVCELLGR